METQVQEKQEEDVANVDVGRVVHISLEAPQSAYERPESYRCDSFCRPALVVRTWGSEHGIDNAINAVMFIDGSNDSEYLAPFGLRPYFEHRHDLVHRDAVGKETARLPGEIVRVEQLAQWVTSCSPNHAVKMPRSWHWPRECRTLELPFRSPGGLYHMHRAGLADPTNCSACRETVSADK